MSTTSSPSGSGVAPAVPADDEAQRRLDAIAAACSGDLGFYARDLRTGRAIARRADEAFPTASLIKVAVLVELERQAAEGTISMAQPLELRDEDKVGGSSLLRHMSAGIRLPLRDWAFLMMQVSDNTATNALVDLAGIERVNATMDREGFPAIRLHHKIDFSALWHDARHLGEGSPRAFAELLAAILEQRLRSVPPEACDDMLRLMDGVGAGERLGRYLDYNPYATQQRERGRPPEETGPVVRFAGKTGSLTGVRTHAAVVWSDETPLRLAMCGMVAGSTDQRWSVDADALVAIAQAGRLAYDILAT
jgi:beta-lactamase class A